MNTHNNSAPPAGHPHSPNRQDVGTVSLKRKLSVFLRPDPRYCYPSPPMSNPPSPPRHPPDNSTPSATAQGIFPSLATSTSSQMPGVAIVPPPARHGMIYSHVGPVPGYPPFGSSSFQPGFALPGQGAFNTVPQPPALAPLAFAGNIAPSTSGETSGGGRKSKAHVASACVNCKRAHLSCDVNRPCARCVSTGKQDSCYDVQHKKRGRPRLREEGEVKVDQVIPQTSIAPSVASTRPIATPRSRRSDSFRSIRTHASEGSLGGSGISPTYASFPGSTLHQRSLSTQATSGTHGTNLYPLPVAFLNLDLLLVKGNRSFQQSLSAGQDIIGCYLNDLVGPNDGQSIESLGRILHEERERHDPAHLPPIRPLGQDPIEKVSEEDVDKFATGFECSRQWVSRHASAGRQIFSARIQLAKSSVYFVVITLSRFQNAFDQQSSVQQSHQPLFVRTPTQQHQQDITYDSAVRSRQGTRASIPHTAIPSYQIPGPAYLPAPQPRGIGQPPTSGSPPRLAPPQVPQWTKFQQRPSFPQPSYHSYAGYTPTLPSLFIPPPPSRMPPQPSSAVELRPDMQRRASHSVLGDRPLSSPAGIIQLPPLMTTPAGPSRRGSMIGNASEASVPVTPTESAPPTSLSQKREKEEGDEELETPRKRRRMGIDEVLRND